MTMMQDVELSVTVRGRPFHQAEIGEAFPDMEASAIADEHYQLRCPFMPCRCTCRACGIRTLRYCEQNHMTTKGDGTAKR